MILLRMTFAVPVMCRLRGRIPIRYQEA
jgi:hypothetical protein